MMHEYNGCRFKKAIEWIYIPVKSKGEMLALLKLMVKFLLTSMGPSCFRLIQE